MRSNQEIKWSFNWLGWVLIDRQLYCDFIFISALCKVSVPGLIWSKEQKNWLLGLTYRVQLVLLLYLHCTQYQPFLQEFLSVTVPSTSESHHSALGPSSLVVVLCQMGCYVPVQEYYLFIYSLFNHVSRLVKGNNFVNQTACWLVYIQVEYLC